MLVILLFPNRSYGISCTSTGNCSNNVCYDTFSEIYNYVQKGRFVSVKIMDRCPIEPDVPQCSYDSTFHCIKTQFGLVASFCLPNEECVKG